MCPARFCWAPRLALLLAVTAGGCCVPESIAGMPESSRPRAARMERWRELLLAAQQEHEAGHDEAAAAHYGEIVRDAGPGAPANVLLARALDGLGDLAREKDDCTRAATLYTRAAEMWERLLGPDQPRLATTLHHLGWVEHRCGDADAARQALTRAMGIWTALWGHDCAEAVNTRRALERVADGAPSGASAVDAPRAGQ